VTELVSILIPAWNAEKWITETIKSAVAQTWPNKEVIIVDDGSSDDTLRVARTFESKIVKVITQKNTGACGARNKALSLAQGSYIQWLDADDLLAPDKISHQLKGSDSGQTSRVLLTAAFAKFFFRYQKARFEPDSLWRDLDPVSWIMNKFMDIVWMNPAAWLVSRRLTELGGLWDERLSPSGDDDGEYMCRLVRNSERVKFVPGARCYYRVGNPASLSFSKSDRALNSFFLARCLCIEHLRALEDSERTRRTCLKHLQDGVLFFYPDKVEILDKARDIARSLGGELAPPFESLKFHLIRKLFGWKSAKRIKYGLHRTKLIASHRWDKLLDNLSNRHPSA
jgi:glycosyltransferase involved in cell wall biosynthesis